MNIIRITRNIVVVLLSFLIIQGISAQNNICIHITGFQSGQITWESSQDSVSWNVIPGETSDSLLSTINQATWFRSVITDGNCEPVLSEAIKINYYLPGSPCQGLSTITDFDGNIYNTVEIGTQCWMKNNLATTHYANGTAITLVSGNSAWAALAASDKAYCYYNNSAANAGIYGALYTWGAVMNGASGSAANPSGVQGICPYGWHVPSDNEWKQLEIFQGMSQIEADNMYLRGTNEGGELKEAGTAHWMNPNTGADNSSGFTALPGGFRYFDGTFDGLATFGLWWTTSGYSSDFLSRCMGNSYSEIVRMYYEPLYGFSVRCVKN